MKGFETFVVELKENINTCVERNVHQRTRDEIEEVQNEWMNGWMYGWMDEWMDG